MSSTKQISLVVVAKAVDDDGWVVDVLQDGELALSESRVKDPLTPSQMATCRWYLEQYAQNAPFSSDRAAEAENLLGDYPDELLKQLPLRRVLLPHLEAGAYTLHSVLLSIDICNDDDACSGESIHRLFWETLEAPQLWSHNSWQVEVRRSVWPHGIDLVSSPQPGLSPPHRAATSALNVLLVIARDLSNDPSQYSDADPDIAANALFKVKEGIRKTNRSTILNLEIARPGTLEALRKHLQGSEQRHGPGYFDIVHFDMHGKVGVRKSKGTMEGFLFFADPHSDKLIPKLGRDVGEVLKRHRVKFAVLNSCESAQASGDENANIAKQFVRSGLVGVLGMSFKVGRHAATTFLEHFYRALLVDGYSFPSAAAAGRAALRSSLARPARFGFQREVNDHFVAVAYGHGHDQFLSQVAPRERKPPIFSLSSLNPDSGRSDDPSYAPEDSLLGRGFDLLRLERQLSQSRIVYLHGLYGIGKTAFLKHAASIWKLSHFADAVVYLDFAMQAGNISAHEFPLLVIRQLLSQVDFKDFQALLWSIPDRSLHSYDSIMINCMISDILNRINSVIVIEGLEEAPLYPLPSSFQESPNFPVVQHIKSLLAIAKDQGKTKRCQFIFSHRRVDPDRLEKLIGHEFGPFRFELGRLDLPDAMELSQRVLRSNGLDIEQWKQEDAEWLESVIDLLQGIPLALVDILPLQKSLNIPWRQFFRRLHSGLFSSRAELEQLDLSRTSFAKDLLHLSRLFIKSHFFLLCLLSNYWHEAVGAWRLLAIFRETADEWLIRELRRREDGIEYWVLIFKLFIYDRGYIQEGSGKDVLSVHPLFTIIGRAFLSEFITLSNRVKLRTMLCASLEAMAFQEGAGKASGAANILTSLNFCLLEVPMESWPIALLGVCFDSGSGHLPLILQTLLQDKYVELLGLIPRKLPQMESRSKVSMFFCVALFSLLFSSSFHNQRKWEQLVNLCETGLGLLESENGELGASDMALCRAYLLSVSVVSLLSLEKNAESREAWDALKRVREGSDFPVLPDLPYLPYLPDLLSSIDLNQLAGSFDLESIISKFPAPPSKDETGPHDRLGWLLSLLELFGAQFPSVFNPATDASHELISLPEDQTGRFFPSNFAQLDVDLVDLPEFKELIRFDSRNAPSKPTTGANTNRKVLNELEAAYEGGEWETISELHLAMAKGAFLGRDFEESRKHLESIQTILSNASVPESVAASFKDIEKEVLKVQLVHMYHQTIFPGRNFNPAQADATGMSTNRSGPIHSQRPSYEERQQFDADSGKWWKWWQSSLGQDARWVDHIYANQDQYKEETELLNIMHVTVKAKDFETALIMLDRLEALCVDGISVCFAVQVSPLQIVRDFFEVSLEQFRLLRILEETFKHKYDEARAIIDELACLRPPFCDWITDQYLEGLRYAVDKMQLLNFHAQFQTEEAHERHEELQKIYWEQAHLLRGDHFSRFEPQEVFVVRAQALERLRAGAARNKSWRDALAYCDEWLEASRPFLAEHPRAQDRWLNEKALCEWELAQESLEAAERGLDFDQCLRRLDEMKKLRARQEKTPGMRRSFFIVIGDQALAFLSDSYRDHCIDCVRWFRRVARNERPAHEGKQGDGRTRPRLGNDSRRSKSSAIYGRPVRASRRHRVWGIGRVRSRHPRRSASGRSKPGRHSRRPASRSECSHDRGQFRRPFGCEHHCEGGYCFLD